MFTVQMGILSSRNRYNDIVLEKKIKSPNNILTSNDPHQKQINLSQGEKKSQKFLFSGFLSVFNLKDPLLRFLKLKSYFFRVYVEKFGTTNQFQYIP